MSKLTAPTFAFAPRDTWPMPVTYRNTNNTDGTPGLPINLTGLPAAPSSTPAGG